jgi:co-chaperonin GroES (HSP10)
VGTEYIVSSPTEIELIDDRVLVRCIEPQKQTDSGVLLPQAAVEAKKEAVQAGEVITVGPGRFTSDGRHENMMDILPGDIAFFPKFQGWQLLIPDENGEEIEYRVFGQHDLFGVKKVASRD